MMRSKANGMCMYGWLARHFQFEMRNIRFEMELARLSSNDNCADPCERIIHHSHAEIHYVKCVKYL